MAGCLDPGVTSIVRNLVEAGAFPGTDRWWAGAAEEEMQSLESQDLVEKANGGWTFTAEGLRRLRHSSRLSGFGIGLRRQRSRS